MKKETRKKLEEMKVIIDALLCPIKEDFVFAKDEQILPSQKEMNKAPLADIFIQIGKDFNDL